MKPIIVLSFVLGLAVCGLLMNSSSLTAEEGDSFQDTTTVAYWKDRALKAEQSAIDYNMLAKANETRAAAAAKDCKKQMDQSAMKVKELNALLEEARKQLADCKGSKH
jgi:hypothetical protein